MVEIIDMFANSTLLDTYAYNKNHFFNLIGQLTWSLEPLLPLCTGSTPTISKRTVLRENCYKAQELLNIYIRHIC